MAPIRNLWIQIQALILSLFRRSLKTHASLRVSDVTTSLSFYRKLGFRQVTSSRSDEVILLRNHRGDELNIVSGVSNSDSMKPVSVSFQTENLNRAFEQLQHWYSDVAIIDDATTRRLQLTDPDNNCIEFFQARERDSLLAEGVYHVTTRAELLAGLSEHYYLPPDRENRFVRARARSAFLELACNRVAEETKGIPILIEMDESQLSIEAQLSDESDYGAPLRETSSAYPHVNSPIPRQALTALGTCDEKDGAFSWPSRFVAVDSVTD